MSFPNVNNFIHFPIGQRFTLIMNSLVAGSVRTFMLLLGSFIMRFINEKPRSMTALLAVQTDIKLSTVTDMEQHLCSTYYCTV